MQFFRALILPLCFAVCLIAQPAKTYASNAHFIFGADFSSSEMKYSHSSKSKKANPDFIEIDDNFKSFSPVIGISAYGISLEAFILNSNTVKKDSVSAKLRAYGVDIAGEASLSDNFSFLASLGLAEYRINTKTKNGSKDDKNSGPRIGVGLQYYLSRNVALRLMYRYTLLNSGEAERYKAISEITAGIRFIF